MENVPTPFLLGLRRFRAMNTDVQLYLRDSEDVTALAAAEELFHSLEARLSRFRPDSELCRLNARAGQETLVSEILFDVLERAQEMHRVTGGLFEPAILPDLETAGYDRSFEQVERSGDGDVAGGDNEERRSISQLRMNPLRLTVTAPPGLRIDLGGIGKGYAVDEAACLLGPMRDFAVNAGGDMFASGDGPDGDGWLVAVTDPMNEGVNLSLLRLHDEALATSTTAVRRWKRGGRLLHHLIDPRTRGPSRSGVLSVSVVAKTAVEADVFAKTALLLGPAEGPRFLERQGTPGFLVLDDGSGVCTSGWTGTPA